MLNRRLIRDKVLKAVYEFEVKRDSLYEISKDNLREKFAYDVFAVEPMDPALCKENQELAVSYFEQMLVSGKTSGENQEIFDAVSEEWQFCQKKIKEEIRSTKLDIVQRTEDVYVYYVVAMAYMLAIKDYVTKLKEDKLKSFTQQNTPQQLFKLENHPILLELEESDEWQKTIDKYSKRVFVDQDLVKGIYVNVLKQNQDYMTYAKAGEVSEEQQLDILKLVFREGILKFETASDVFSEIDIDWENDKNAVKNMVYSTFNDIAAGELKMAELSANWDDDRDFLTTLYLKTVESFDGYKAMFANDIKNWDMDRISKIDRAIIIVALAEMINFPGIPVKVSINEYIELAKIFGTVSSHQFINGVLDKVSKRLIDEGEIKKSGRGLID